MSAIGQKRTQALWQRFERRYGESMMARQWGGIPIADIATEWEPVLARYGDEAIDKAVSALAAADEVNRRPSFPPSLDAFTHLLRSYRPPDPEPEKPARADPARSQKFVEEATAIASAARQGPPPPPPGYVGDEACELVKRLAGQLKREYSRPSGTGNRRWIFTMLINYSRGKPFTANQIENAVSGARLTRDELEELRELHRAART